MGEFEQGITRFHQVMFSCIMLVFERVLCLGMEKAMAPLSSTLAWKIPWMEEPGRLQSIELLRVGHD